MKDCRLPCWLKICLIATAILVGICAIVFLYHFFGWVIAANSVPNSPPVPF